MTFLAFDALKGMKKDAYKKRIAKDKKQLSKAKGVLVLDDYKFDNGKDTALVFTKKAKMAKEQFKAAKDQGHSPSKMARGTCELAKEGSENVLKINFLEGGLAPETVQTACTAIFNALSVRVQITNIPGPEPQESDEPDTDQDQEEPEEEEGDEEEMLEAPKSMHQQLVEQARTIADFMSQKFPPLVEKVKTKTGVTLEDYFALDEECKAVRSWVDAFNSTDKPTRDKIGPANAIQIKECYSKLVQVRLGALRCCPEAVEWLKAQSEENQEQPQKKTQPQDQQQPNKDQKPKDQQQPKDKQQPYQNQPDKEGQHDAPEQQEQQHEDSPKEQVQPVQNTAQTTPTAPKTIGASVGNKGFNRRDDVIVVQNLLRAAGYNLTADGACGQKTINAITDFQRNRCNMARPDGRIDPGGGTWNTLLKAGVPAPPVQPHEPLFKTLTDSVGQGGKNKSMDVLLVQEMLQKVGFTLAADGVCGPKTIALIREFQAAQMKNKTVNGIVTPNGETWRALLAGKISDKIDLRNKDVGKYDYTRVAYDLFVKGTADDHEIDETDIQQGQIGNCYFMSALAAVAKNNPEAIRKLIKDKGDGTFDVTLYAKGTKLALEPTIVNVKPDFVTDSRGNLIYAGSGDRELWVMLLEKAYAKLNGGYDDTGEGGFIEAGLEAITGQDAKVYMLSKFNEEEIKNLITTAITNKKPITAASTGSGEKEFKTEAGTIIYQGHAYSIESLTGDKLFLRNPWGYDHATISVKEFKQYFNHFVF